jgi:hypothetical protein
MDVREVVEERLVGVRIGAVEVDVHQHARLHRHDDDALEADELGQEAHHLIDAVLDVDRRDARVRARLEDHLDGRLARARRVGRHVTHAWHAVDRALHGDERGLDEDLRARARIRQRDGDDGRGDRGELRDGSAADREHAEEHDQDGDDDREDRSVDELLEHGEVGSGAIERTASRARRRSARTSPRRARERGVAPCEAAGRITTPASVEARAPRCVTSSERRAAEARVASSRSVHVGEKRPRPRLRSPGSARRARWGGKNTPVCAGAAPAAPSRAPRSRGNPAAALREAPHDPAGRGLPGALGSPKNAPP